MSSSELLELEEEMEYSYNDGQKGKTAMNTILELGKTLLHSAREGDTMSVIDLMSKGAPFTTDWLGTSPLHLAAMNNHLDTCETLLRAGIGKDAKTKVERSPLHFAAYEGHTPIVQLLLQHKAEVDCRDMLHMTPLHWAVERQHEACAVLLVQAGADPAAVSRFHKTPMSIAEEMGWDSMWEVLHSAHQQRSKESINNTAQAVEGISGGTCLRAEDMIIEPDILEDDGNMGDHESETHDHIENILPKVTHSNNEAAVQMLREHGIMMIPHDNTNTVTSAVQSGRKIVLSDAGKLMLKDISETPKGIEIMKKEGQGGKGTNAKIYTMSSSQFLAIAGQNKNNILKKIPINTNKPLNSNTNVNRLKTLPVLKAININRSPTKTVGDNKTISPYKGRVISINSFTKLSDELMNVKAMASQGRAKVIQLKNASNLGKTVKIVVKNTGSNQKFVIPKISSNNSELISSSMNATTALSMPALSEIEPHNTEVTTMQKQEDVETLKKQLAETREELETYKKKFQILEDELNLLKNTHHMIQTTQEEPELVTQVVETGYDSTEMDATTEEHEFVDTQEPEFVDTQEVEYSDLANESVIDTTIVESELDTSEMESG